jgi:hypothetical protein
MLDYCLLESIYLLSTSSKAKYKTWCNATKPAFNYLASSRTIATRFKYLEAKGWLIFKDEKRFLKKTSDKYFCEVYAYILGMKKLHPKHEETSPPGMKKLHPKHEETSPNNNSNSIDSNKKESKKGAPSSEDALENNFIKNQDEKEKEKSPAKKEKHIFPDNTPRKSYKVTPPPTFENSKKPFEIFLNNYPFEAKGWSKQIIKDFLLYCEIRAEGRQLSTAQIKLRLTEINEALKKHDNKDIVMILKAAQNGRGGGWASFEFDERIKDRLAAKNKKKHNVTESYDIVKDQLNDPNFLFKM